jgi:ribonuclease P protein component
MVVPLNATPSGSGRPFRFSRQFRLKSPLAIRRIIADGASSRRRWDAFRLVWSELPGFARTNHPSFAFVVSRHAGPAVVRNRIKRRLREAVRLQRDVWPLRPTQIIIRVNEGKAAVVSFEDLREQVRSALTTVKASAEDIH